MKKSTCSTSQAARLHVAVIMDGNGRWARARGRPRTWGHQEGIEAVRRVVRAAPGLGVGTLTLYAFSSDNWGRPAEEVAAILRLLRAYLRREVGECVARGIRLTFLGRRDRLPAGLAALVTAAEEATGGGRALHLRLAIDYSSRDAIAGAAARLAARDGSEDAAGGRNGAPEWRAGLSRLLLGTDGAGVPVPDVDLLIRTGGERRLSDFLLWECAYAELVFTRRMWPDFDAPALDAALAAFRRRRRRFGRLPDEPASDRRTA